MKFDLRKIRKIYFIGIGGIGVSAIARMMLLSGKEVSGSDSGESEVTEDLKKFGAKIYIGQKTENISEDFDLVVYTIAIREDNPEFLEAKRLGLKMMTYPEILGEISKDKYTIAVSGTHGKTTTTAMIAKILMDAERHPNVVVGSFLKNKDGGRTNFVAGEGKEFVVEACEYKRSFLNLSPKILVITNIDNDHLDYYKDTDDIINAFGEMSAKVPNSGYIVCNPNDKSVSYAVENSKATIVNYMDFFDKDLKLKIPGHHNKIDASAGLAVAHILGIDKKSAKKSLEDFSGTWRRFEFKGKTANGTVVYDDYGHHPTEIKATLAGAREIFGNKKIIAVFQPHLYSRTKILLEDFATAFVNADDVLLAPIYAAREKNDPAISSEILSQKIGEKAKSFKNFEEIEVFLRGYLNEDDVVITIGAGDIYKIGEKLVK